MNQSMDYVQHLVEQFKEKEITIDKLWELIETMPFNYEQHSTDTFHNHIDHNIYANDYLSTL